MLNSFHRLIDSNREETVSELRVNLLKIYKNLFDCKVDVKFVAKTLSIILKDERYYKREDSMLETLNCLYLVACKNNAWEQLNSHQEIIQKDQIAWALYNMVLILEEHFSAPCFSILVDFLAELLVNESERTNEEAEEFIAEFHHTNFFF